jgi:hypothetical protein
MTMRRIQCYVPDELYRLGCAAAERRGVPLSRLVHQLIAVSLRTLVVDAPCTPAARRRVRQEGPRQQINISVDRALGAAVAERAREMGASPAGWVSAVVAAELGRPPRLPKEALQALAASNRQLWSIGTLLNQIARAVNTDRHAGATIALPTRFDELLTAVVETVEAHTRQVASFVAAARHRPRGGARTANVAEELVP